MVQDLADRRRLWKNYIQDCAVLSWKNINNTENRHKNNNTCNRASKVTSLPSISLFPMTSSPSKGWPFALYQRLMAVNRHQSHQITQLVSPSPSTKSADKASLAPLPSMAPHYHAVPCCAAGISIGLSWYDTGSLRSVRSSLQRSYVRVMQNSVDEMGAQLNRSSNQSTPRIIE